MAALLSAQRASVPAWVGRRIRLRRSSKTARHGVASGNQQLFLATIEARALGFDICVQARVMEWCGKAM
jgi:hypothetical protein